MKNIKQDEVRRLRNKARKNTIATAEKGFTLLLEAGKMEDAQAALNACISAYDNGAKKGVISKQKADRKKSRLTINFNQAQA